MADWSGRRFCCLRHRDCPRRFVTVVHSAVMCGWAQQKLGFEAKATVWTGDRRPRTDARCRLTRPTATLDRWQPGRPQVRPRQRSSVVGRRSS
eukprot:5230137-Prorocentrum_lima.AAC.1